MTKGYYIHFDAKISLGVKKKIDMQIEEFKKYVSIEEINIQAKNVSIFKRLLRLLPGGAIERTYQNALDQMENPDFLYVRRTTADRFYVEFFKEVKKKWPGCKVIVEIFTYPYDKDDFFRPFAWPYYFKENWNRKKLVGLVDRYVTYSRDKVIFGISTINTGNGVLFDKVQPPAIKNESDDTVNLIAVAYMQKHHGYERVIKGMYAYYQKDNVRRIVLHLIGDGPEKKRYQKLVQRYKLEDKVLFYPSTTGVELDCLYETGDIAISALGVYKDGIDRENSIKTREYLAKGFPMIVGCKVDGISEDYPFVCQFSNDATPICIDKVVEYYEKLLAKYTKREIQEEIRNYGRRIADMQVVLQPIIEYIKE